MTKEQALTFGFELLKVHEAPLVFFWLADEGWKGGWELQASQVDEEHIGLHIQQWAEATLATVRNPN